MNEQKSYQFCYDLVAGLASPVSPNVTGKSKGACRMLFSMHPSIYRLHLDSGEELGLATVTLANLVAFAFFPVFILKLSTIDCEHEHYSKIKQGPVSCVDSIVLPREVSLRGLPEF